MKMRKSYTGALLGILCCFFLTQPLYALDVNSIEEVDKIPNRYTYYQSASSSSSRLPQKFSLYQSTLMEKNALAEKYDLREDLATLRIKDQKSSKSCWAFSTLSVLESNVQKTTGEVVDYSERHMNYATSKTFLQGKINPWGYNRELDDGGNPMIGLSYVTRGSGPVNEMDMPFSEKESKIDLAEIEGKTISRKINNYVVYPTICKEKQADGSIKYTDGMENGTVYTETEVQDIRNQIKEHIQKYGAVTAMTMSGSAFEDYYNFNMTYPAYYNDNSQLEANHQVTIVGWDDTYPVGNFSPYHRPKNPGAYLVLNSYGTTGRFPKGLYYISYEDALVESCAVGVVDTEKANYAQIYQHDPLGISSNIKINGSKNLYGANVFTRSQTQKIEVIYEISVASQVEMDAELYVNEKDGNLNSEELKEVSNGMIHLKAGYNTYKLQKPITLTGDKFAVAVQYKGGENDAYIGAEIPSASKYWAIATSEPGQSFVGSNLNDWQDLSNTSIKNANICIKVFTQNVDDDIISSVYQIDEQNKRISQISPHTYRQVFETNLQTNANLKILHENGENIGTEEYLATGMRLVLNDNKSYTLAVKGDLNGDGEVTLTDVAKIKLHLIGLRLLEGAYLQAANVDDDQQITITDLSRIRKAYFGEINL